MTSASSRRSFYPRPPSAYPMPLVDPCPALETTYGHSHCSHSLRDEHHFRSRTLNEHSETARALHSAGAVGFGGLGAPGVPQGDGSFGRLGGPGTAPSLALAHASQGIYPKHGTGNFVTPYYRRDSTGFRRPYAQPTHVDDTYTARKDLSPLVQSGFQLAHPQSRPTYAASKGSLTGTGAVFGTSYRNSGLYDSNALTTGRVAREVGEKLQQQRSQQLAASYRQHYPQNGVPALQPGQHDDSQQAWDSAYEQSIAAAASERAAFVGQSEDGLGYYTGEVRDAPPPGAEVAADGVPQSNLEGDRRRAAAASQPRDLAGDPLKEHALDNAYRKSQTVYKRSFGLSM